MIATLHAQLDIEPLIQRLIRWQNMINFVAAVDRWDGHTVAAQGIYSDLIPRLSCFKVPKTHLPCLTERPKVAVWVTEGLSQQFVFQRHRHLLRTKARRWW